MSRTPGMAWSDRWVGVMAFALLLAAPAIMANATTDPAGARPAWAQRAQVPRGAYDYSAVALSIANYLLNQQDSNGAIPDEPGGRVVNEDSNMEYALIGLGAAYWYSKDPRYLSGLEKGIRWLAAREEMTDPTWRGSWRYAYSSRPPYAPRAVSTGDGILDVRGVDATSSLFVYLLHLHRTLSGSDALAQEFATHARAALDFILANNRSPDGFFISSWQQRASDGQWVPWTFRYTADQGDVFLGLWAGGRLSGDTRYTDAAAVLAANGIPMFFHAESGNFALGTHEDGSQELDVEEFNRVFPQGYIPWLAGGGDEALRAYQWLADCAERKGNAGGGYETCTQYGTHYSLTAAIYAMAASSLGRPRPAAVLDQALAAAYDPQDGGVRDTDEPWSDKISNVAGFMIVGLLQFPPFVQ